MTRDEMFPNLPEDWFTDNGGPLTTKLVNANGDLVDTVTVDGKGTYTIDPDTGKVTFTPIATFVGKADPVTIAVDGLKYASGKSVPVRTTYTPFVTKDGTVLPNASHVASAVGEPDTVTPSYTDNGFNIDPTSAVFPDGSKTKQVDGEGTWTINPDTGAFTFTPEPGFTGSPTPVSYSAVGRDTGMRVDGGQVTIAYPDAYTKPATTVGPQGQPQTSTTTGGQNAGLQAEDMFPTVPTEWFGANATKRRGDGSPLVQFFLKDADGNNVTELEVTGKNPDTGLDEVAGIYTIDSITGAVKFTPRQEFLGSAPAAVITTDGLSTELTSGYTPYLFPPRVELPSGNETAPALGVPVVIGDDEDLIWAGGSGSAAFMVNKESIQLLPNTDGSTVSDDGKTLTVPGEGTWSVTLVGDAPAPGAEDTRRVEFTFTPEKGFISDPTPLDYTAKNTDGVQSTTPGQIVASYPYATPADAVTTAPQGVTQTAADNNSPDDQGKTIAQMFPKISQLPADWNVTYKLQDGDGNPVDSVTIDGQGTYSIDNQGLVSFVPEAGFTGTADGVTIVPLVDGEQLISGINGSFIPASAKYTAVVTGFGTPPVTTTTRPVDYRTVIVSDDSLTVGESVVETKGELGEETLQADGTWTLTTAAKDQVIRVGAKPVTGSDTVVWTDPIPYETTYRENPDLKPGEVKEVQAGVLGETTNTVTVTFDAQGKPTQSAPVSEVTKQPVERILEYGPGADDQRTIERVDTIPFETEYVIDDTLKEGETKVVQEGQTGSRTVSTTVTVVDGKIVGEPAIDEKVIKEPVKRIVRIGVSKTIVPTPEVEEVPFETKVVFDPTMDPGTQKETQPGKPGVRELIDGTWVVTTQPKDRVIAVGSKVLTGEDEVKWVAEIPFETQVRVNPDLQPGEHRVVQEGTPGKETFSVKFTLNPDGTVSREESSARTVEPVTKIIEVGPQTSYPSTFEDTSTIPFNTEVIYDDTLLAGESVVDQEGVDGERTTSYVIDLVDGNIVVGEPTVTAKDPVKRIIRVGTKPPAPVPSDPDKPEPGQQSSGNSVIERCFANGFALNSPLMWLLPIVLFAAIGSPLAATMQRIVGQAIGEFNNTALGRQASEADRQLRRQLGLGGSNDDWTRRFQQAFAGDNQQLARLNAELGKLNSQYGEQIRIGAAIAAGLALTGLLATQACSEEGFAGWGIPASSSEADKDAAAQAGAETSSRLGSSSASEPGAR
ncbi:MAG: G5 domain-containing protein [Corynebacterium sp.]|nr:G5 domain-containing protein [Corynebacterium sp.]